jgi:hypothetical protein
MCQSSACIHDNVRSSWTLLNDLCYLERFYRAKSLCSCNERKGWNQRSTGDELVNEGVSNGAPIIGQGRGNVKEMSVSFYDIILEKEEQIEYPGYISRWKWVCGVRCRGSTRARVAQALALVKRRRRLFVYIIPQLRPICLTFAIRLPYAVPLWDSNTPTGRLSAVGLGSGRVAGTARW